MPDRDAHPARPDGKIQAGTGRRAEDPSRHHRALRAARAPRGGGRHEQARHRRGGGAHPRPARRAAAARSVGCRNEGAPEGPGARPRLAAAEGRKRSEEHTSELQSPCNLVCRLLLEKKKNHTRKSLRVAELLMLRYTRI